MGAFRRITDILSANVHELIDSWEAPITMMKQAIREMEPALAEATQATARALANQKMIARQVEENQKRIRLWHDRAQQRLTLGDDTRARLAVQRKLETVRVTESLREQLSDAEHTSQSLRRQLDGMRAKTAEARRVLATLMARQQFADARRSAVEAIIATGAFDRFDRLKERAAQAEAETKAAWELCYDDFLADAPWKLEQDDLEVEAALLEMKTSIK